jgi:hypothetical protein
MADLNALIAQGAQFKAPVDPFAQYAQMQQLEQASSTNQLNRMKMEDYRRKADVTNRLGALDPAAADYLAQIKRIDPKLGFDLEQQSVTTKNLGLTGLKTQADVAKVKKDMLGSSLRDMASNPSDENIIAHTQDYALNPLFKDDLPSIQANAKRLLAMTPDQRKAVLSGTGATAADLKPPAPTNIANLIRERNALPQGDPNRKLYDQQINDLGAANRNAQERLAFDKQKFNWEKANPGYELKEDANGGMVAINKRTLEAVPVMVGGAAAPVAGAPAVNIPQMIDPKQSSKKEPIDSTDIKKYADKFFKGDIKSAIEDLKKQGWVEKPADGAALAIVGPRTQLMGKDSTKTAVSEQQAAYNIGRVLTAANEIKNITSKNPSAVQPGAMEAFASSLGMGGTANLARDADRQIVQGAQRDALDALLYLATGAAYNKEQLQGQMDAYIPSYTDTDEAVVAKKSRMTELIKSAKTRAGKSWTPEMDKAMAALTGPAAPDAAAPVAGNPVYATNGSQRIMSTDGGKTWVAAPAAK